MKQIIFRVDDRLIHGQVVEGWIKNFHIPRVVIVSDRISTDELQQFIYKSVVPGGTQVSYYSLDAFISAWQVIVSQKGTLLVLFESLADLLYCRTLVSNEVYINIGCIASRVHSIEVSDTVFLEPEELEELKEFATKWEIHIKKLPWEKGSSI